MLLSSTVKSRHTDTATPETTVLTEMEIIGDDIPDQVLRILRRVRAENPGDLDSPLHIHFKVVEGEETAEQKPGQPKLAPTTSKRLATARPAAGTRTPSLCLRLTIRSHASDSAKGVQRFRVRTCSLEK